MLSLGNASASLVSVDHTQAKRVSAMQYGVYPAIAVAIIIIMLMVMFGAGFGWHYIIVPLFVGVVVGSFTYKTADILGNSSYYTKRGLAGSINKLV